MATTGLYGYRENEKDTFAYVGAGAYPEKLGRAVLNSLAKDIFRKEDIATLVDDPSIESEPGVHLRDFDIDALNWMYLANLDSSVLEVHTDMGGLNFDPKGRYVVKKEPPNFEGFQLIHEIPFTAINPSLTDYLLENIETATQVSHLTRQVIESKGNKQ
jgi:hypothetical protein